MTLSPIDRTTLIEHFFAIKNQPYNLLPPTLKL